jgi:hypothetical protein
MHYLITIASLIGLLTGMGLTAGVTLAVPREIIVAPVGANNPRNSEAAIIPLKDGSLLLAWTEFYASSGADHGPARIVGRASKDDGKTWGTKYTLIENDGCWEPACIELKDGRVLMLMRTGMGGLSLKLKILPAAWFYQ